MERNSKRAFFAWLSSSILFVLWTVLVSFVDKKAIGPNNSSVGFSTINGFFHKLFVGNFILYEITDWCGLIPIAVALGFAILGAFQCVKRKSILKVDKSLLILGCFYLVVFFIYLLFERVVINYRPVLINGFLEPSYPSSTTMLVLTFMPTAIMQFNRRIKNNSIRKGIKLIIYLFIAFMVVGRFLSGVHWFSDIVGGILISTTLVLIYYGIERNCKN